VTIDLRQFASYEDASRRFELELGSSLNVADAVAERAGSDKLALLCIGGQAGIEALTFGALAEASARVGSGLRGLGVGRGSRVCAVLPSTPEAAIVEVAVLRAGGVFVGLRPSDPEDVLRHQIASARPQILICAGLDAERVRDLAPGDHPIVAADRGDWAGWWAGLPSPAGALPSVRGLLERGDTGFGVERTAPEDPAVITFTSGSTGAAKAVVLPHSSFFAGIPAFQMYTDLAPQPGDVFFTVLGWISVGGFRTLTFPAWYFGAPVVAADRTLDGPSVCRLLSDLRVTVAHVMPQTLRDIRELGDRVGEYDWSALRAIAYAGESISPEVHAWTEKYLGANVNPYYGASEIAFVTSTCGAWFDSPHGVTGRRAPGRQFLLVEEDTLEPAAPGQVGMLAVRRTDPGLALGYLGSDEAVRFESSSATDELYLTHDLGVVSREGDLRYLGRSGQLIRTPTGGSLAPSDIEDAIVAIDGIREAAVVPAGEGGGGGAAACISLTTGAPAETASRKVAELVAKRFDGLAVRRVVVVPDVPKTPGTAKINRRLAAERIHSGPADGAFDFD
jgi:acetyl-CoA synthetase